MGEINLQGMHSENLLSIYDVVLDVEQERQLDRGRISFPILRQIVRFSQLMPADSVGMRDRYIELRWKAAKFLEREGIVHNVSFLEHGHRWESYIQLDPDPSEFPKFFEAVGKEYARRTPGKQATKAPAVPPRAQGGVKIFVVHGRNLRLRNGMFAFLRSIGLDPIEWAEAVAMTGKAAPYIGEVLETAFSNAQAIVVLLTGDDEARLRRELHGEREATHEAELTPQARPNVLFEAGMAMAY